jgi:hypothetical protein
MRALLLSIFVVCALPGQEAGRSTALELNAKTAVLAADADYRSAVLHGDGVKLAAMFADEILIVHSDGTTDTKKNFVDAISSGRLKLTSYQRKRRSGPSLWISCRNVCENDEVVCKQGKSWEGDGCLDCYVCQGRRTLADYCHGEYAPKRVE